VLRLFRKSEADSRVLFRARICDVRIGVNADSSRQAKALANWVPMGPVEAGDIFIDARLVEHMPAQPRMTLRGLGPFRHIDLDLTGEQCAQRLYPAPH
jgi:hypothetical protein